MDTSAFDKETLLDLTVNFIPLAILLFFIGLFAITNPFGWDGTYSVLMYALVIAPFVLLGILTYLSGKAISEDEHRLEREPAMADEHANVGSSKAIEVEDDEEPAEADDGGDEDATGTSEDAPVDGEGGDVEASADETAADDD